MRDLRYFWFRDASLDGIPFKVARPGWSKQGEFELYLLDQSKGDALWNVVREAGQPFDIGPEYPNPSERTESGLINWDVDADPWINPFELRMGKFVDLTLGDEVIGMAALRRIASRGPARHQLGIVLDGRQEDEDQSIRLVIERKGVPVGHITHKAWSYRLQRMIGYALVKSDIGAGTGADVLQDGTRRSGHLVDLPFSI